MIKKQGQHILFVSLKQQKYKNNTGGAKMHFAKSTFPSGNNALIPKVSAYPSKCFPKLPIVPFQFFIKKRKKNV